MGVQVRVLLDAQRRTDDRLDGRHKRCGLEKRYLARLITWRSRVRTPYPLPNLAVRLKETLLTGRVQVRALRQSQNICAQFRLARYRSAKPVWKVRFLLGTPSALGGSGIRTGLRDQPSGVAGSSPAERTQRTLFQRQSGGIHSRWSQVRTLHVLRRNQQTFGFAYSRAAVELAASIHVAAAHLGFSSAWTRADALGASGRRFESCKPDVRRIYRCMQRDGLSILFL